VTIGTAGSADTAGGTADDLRRLTPADELFFNLDGRDVGWGGDRWRLAVCGIHSDGANFWIQLSVSGFITCGVTLRATCLAASEVLDTIVAWLPHMLREDRGLSVVSTTIQ